jgi:perosamine synthetase
MKRIADKELEYVKEVLNTQFRASSGSLMTQRLEEKFAKMFGVKYAISHINGTATLHSALVAAGVGPGDEVIVPPLTMASTSLAVLHAGAVPVFADVDAATFNIDPADIARKVTPATKVIMPVALYGLSPDMDSIMKIASKHNLIVVEDDAECLLGYYKGRIVGSIGDMSSFSFQSSKQMTSGEGGMVITNDKSLADKVRAFGSLGYATVSGEPGKGKITKKTIQDPNYNRHTSVGWNYRMPELCAAVALAQLEKLEELIALRIKIAALYREAIRGCRWLVPQAVLDGYVHSYWTYVAKLDNHGEFSWYDFRDKYMELGGDGIYAAWQLNYMEPVLSNDYKRGMCPVAESLQPYLLLQFKTNYMDMDVAEQKAEALSATIDYFGR